MTEEPILLYYSINSNYSIRKDYLPHLHFFPLLSTAQIVHFAAPELRKNASYNLSWFLVLSDNQTETRGVTHACIVPNLSQDVLSLNDDFGIGIQLRYEQIRFSAV